MNLIEREKKTHGFSIIFTFLIILSYFYVIYKNLSYVEKNEIKYLNKIYDDFKLIKRYERPLN
jgi:hypothetical protein